LAVSKEITNFEH